MLNMGGAGGRRLNDVEVALRLSYASQLMRDAAAAMAADEPGFRSAIEDEAARVEELVRHARRGQRV
jgi:hypothetical protein